LEAGAAVVVYLHEIDLLLPEVVSVGVIQYARDVSVTAGAVAFWGIQFTFARVGSVIDVLL